MDKELPHEAQDPVKTKQKKNNTVQSREFHSQYIHFPPTTMNLIRAFYCNRQQSFGQQRRNTGASGISVLSVMQNMRPLHDSKLVSAKFRKSNDTLYWQALKFPGANIENLGGRNWVGNFMSKVDAGSGGTVITANSGKSQAMLQNHHLFYSLSDTVGVINCIFDYKLCGMPQGLQNRCSQTGNNQVSLHVGKL